MHENSQKLTTAKSRIPRLYAALGIAIALWLASWSAPALSQDPWHAFSSALGWDIAMERLDDFENHLTPDDVMAASQQGGTHTMKGTLNAGYIAHTVWLKFEVPAAPQAQPHEPLWLLARPSYLDSVILYQRTRKEGLWHSQISGDHVPAAHKPGLSQHLFRMEPGATALVRIQTTSASQFSGRLMSTQALMAQLASTERLTGLSFGAMLALTAGIGAAAMIFRTRALLALTVLGCASMAHVSNVRGYSALAAPESWTLWSSHAVGMGAFMIAAVVAWQIKEQLTHGTGWHRTDRLLAVLIAINLLGMLSVPLGFYGSVAWINLASLVLSDIIAITLCGAALRRQEKPVQHTLLLMAYGMHAIGGIPIALLMTGALQWELDPTALWQAEIIIFMALLACAIFCGMVLKYRRAQKAKDLAVERLTQSELLLEGRIAQRTAELSETQTALAHALRNERSLRGAQQQFFHMISHEFRTPLAVVDSAAAEQQVFPSPDLKSQTDRATQIRRACRRLTSLVDSCLISERMDAGGFTLQAAPTTIPALLEYAAELVNWSPRHHLHLSTDTAPQEWVCDGMLVHIALSNLVDNAVKYANAGTITIAACKNSAGMLEFSVADEGSGMTLEVMNRIFERFERGDRTDQTKGFGLGLWVARRIARLHGGDITVESRLGEGSRFILTLKAQQTSTMESTISPSSTRPQEKQLLQGEGHESWII